MARTTTNKNTPKAGTKGSAARKGKTTPLGNTRAIDDNYVPPKRSRDQRMKTVTLAEAIAEQAEQDGVSVDEVTEQLAAPPKDADKPTRPAGTSNLANTIRSHRGNYTTALHPNGKKTQNNGDVIATMLLTIPLDKLKVFSAANFDGKTYDHLNPGHARMCIGNNIRGRARKEPAILDSLAELQPKVEAESAE